MFPTEGPPELRPDLRAGGDDHRGQAAPQEEEAPRQAELKARVPEAGAEGVQQQPHWGICSYCPLVKYTTDVGVRI